MEKVESVIIMAQNSGLLTESDFLYVIITDNFLLYIQTPVYFSSSLSLLLLCYDDIII